MIVFPEHEKDLIQKAVEYCLGEVDFIDFYCTSAIYEESLLSLNFIDTIKENINLPSVFNPISYNRKKSLNFMFKLNEKTLRQKANINLLLSDQNNWFIVRGDCDVDRAY